MTDIDTAAIRAAMDRIGRDGNGSKLVTDLCDALDAARAKYDEIGDEVREMDVQIWIGKYRDEQARAEAAEARIAAALAIHKRVELGDYLDGSPMPDVCLACQENNVAGKKLWPCPTVRALTEGTGQ